MQNLIFFLLILGWNMTGTWQPTVINCLCSAKCTLRKLFNLRWNHDCTIIAGKGKGYFSSLFFFPCAAWRLIFLQRRLQWVGWAEGSALTEPCRRLCSGNPNPQWPLTCATAATSAPERGKKEGKKKERKTLRYSEDGEKKQVYSTWNSLLPSRIAHQTRCSGLVWVVRMWEMVICTTTVILGQQ